MSSVCPRTPGKNVGVVEKLVVANDLERTLGETGTDRDVVQLPEREPDLDRDGVAFEQRSCHLDRMPDAENHLRGVVEKRGELRCEEGETRILDEGDGTGRRSGHDIRDQTLEKYPKGSGPIRADYPAGD